MRDCSVMAAQCAPTYHDRSQPDTRAWYQPEAFSEPWHRNKPHQPTRNLPRRGVRTDANSQIGSRMEKVQVHETSADQATSASQKSLFPALITPDLCLPR